MIVTKLILHKSKRLSLTNHNTIIFTPTKSNILLGKNGYGKSSLLAELTPLPTDIKKGFKDGGYKELHLTHNDSIFTIKYDRRMSFIKDGVELNTAGNRRVQLELIKNHFNITPYTDKVLNGYRTLTNMSIAERKDIFTKISKVDFEYPLMIFNKFKRRRSDLKGIINILKLKLSETKPIDELHLLQLNRKVKEASDIITDLLKEKPAVYELISNPLRVKEINSRIKRLVKTMDSDVKDVNNELVISEARLDQIVKQLSSVPDIDREELTKEFNTLSTEIKEYVKIIDTYNITEPLDLVVNYLPGVINNINHQVSDLDDYETYLTLPAMDILTSEVSSVEVSVQQATSEVYSLESKIAHFKEIESGQHINCPKCNYGFLPGYDKEEHTKAIESHRVRARELEELITKHKHLVAKIKIKQKFNTIHTNISNILEPYKYVKSIYGEINLKEYDGKSNYLLTVLNSLKVYFTRLNRYKEIEQLLANGNGVDVGTLLKEKSKLEILVTGLRNEQSKYLSYIDKQGKLVSLRRELVKELDKRVIDRTHANDESINMFIDTATNNLQNVVNKYKTELDILKNEKLVIHQRQKDIADSETRVIEVENILKTLDPSKGLIAKYALNDINGIISDMNKIIDLVWDYNLKIVGLNTDDGNINYKFNVVVGENNMVDDVSLLSSSQKEIVDLAFRLVCANRLDMMDNMFILDEFGRTFDRNHKGNINKVITLLVDETSQLFIITHDQNEVLSDVVSSVSSLTDDYPVKYNRILLQ